MSESQYLRMTFYEFVEILRGYFGREYFYAAVVVKEDFHDDYLNFVKNESFINFVSANSPVKPGVINVMTPDCLNGVKFNALLSDICLSLEETFLVVDAKADDNVVLFGHLGGWEEVTAHARMDSRTKTTHLLDELENSSTTYLEIKTDMVCKQPGKYINVIKPGYIEVYRVSLLIKKRIIPNIMEAKESKGLRNMTDVKNGKVHLLNWLINKMTYEFVEQSEKPDVFTLFFKRPYTVAGQTSTMRKLTEGEYHVSTELIDRPFLMQQYSVIGFKLERQFVKGAKGFNFLEKRSDFNNYREQEYLQFNAADIDLYLP